MVTLVGQPFKQEIEWSHEEELFIVEKRMIMDPRVVTVDGQPVKQEIEWYDEMDIVEKRHMIMEEFPFSSPPSTSLAPQMASSSPLPPAGDVKMRLSGGKAVPATLNLFLTPRGTLRVSFFLYGNNPRA